MKDKDKVNTSRRDLLKGLTAASIAGAVVAGTTQAAHADESTPADVKPDKKTGYRETQHVRDYYDTL
ncbi:twin-arginine translocation signal domain-containing protein [Vibrio sp. WXL103]|uniref:twin-arginine translocation signal domain-containing protein n=1 Tax=unclassified Vibrio TaxID=2614977 RepID=UPI003EC6C99C